MLTRITAIVLGVIVLGVILASRLEAPPIPMWHAAPAPQRLEAGQYCAPLDCAAVSVAAAPGFDYPEAEDFVPDRRPALRINIFGGPCLTPPSGGSPWWHDLNDADGNGLIDGVDTLIGKFDDAYADGWRRLIIRLPAGSYNGPMSSSQWWPMPDSKRQSIALAFPAWLATHPDATIGMYAGYPVLDPCRLCMQACGGCLDCDGGGSDCTMCPECGSLAPAHWPETTNPDDMCIVFQNIEPWIGIGLYEIWLDDSGGGFQPKWDTTLRLAGNPDYAGRIRFASEAIVIAGQQSTGLAEPVMSVVERMAFVSLRRNYELVGINAPVEAWTFDPMTTEVLTMFGDNQFCIDQNSNDGNPCTGCEDWCNGPDPTRIDVIYEFMQRGTIPAPSAIEADLVRRILDMNVQNLPCAEDLDADGDVDGADADRLATNIGMTTGATLYHGDIDFDDDVDIIDYFLLVSRQGFPGPCN